MIAAVSFGFLGSNWTISVGEMHDVSYMTRLHVPTSLWYIMMIVFPPPPFFPLVCKDNTYVGCRRPVIIMDRPEESPAQKV